MRGLRPATGIVVALLGATVANAARITVTTEETGAVADGTCSIAEAIANANSGAVYADCIAGDAGFDIVELQTSASYEVESIRVSDDFVLAGNGSTIRSRLSTFLDGIVGVYVDIDFVGHDKTETGSAIHVRDATLIVEGCSFSNYYTPVFVGCGSTSSIRNSTFVDNRTALMGMGIACSRIGISFHQHRRYHAHCPPSLRAAPDEPARFWCSEG